MTLQSFDRLQLAMFSGKGGVGKTTLACGFARHWAQQFPQQRTLLLSTDPAHSLGDVLQMPVSDVPRCLAELPNLQVRALDAAVLLQAFKATYGEVLELLVERGSFVQQEDLSPVWDLGFPGLDELMGILEIQRILREHEADRVVVDMAPSGHTLNLFGLMDVLDEFIAALELFQEKHRHISRSFTGRYVADAADDFLQTIKADLANGRHLLQNQGHTACLVVAIAEPMSLLETKRFLQELAQLGIPCGGLWVNRLLQQPTVKDDDLWPVIVDRIIEQQHLLTEFLVLAEALPVYAVPLQTCEPAGGVALDALIAQAQRAQPVAVSEPVPAVQRPTKLLPSLPDFVTLGRRLVLIGGKGGVGKTTIAAAIALGMATQHTNAQIQAISIDPAHSLGDAFGLELGHRPIALTPNLTAQEVDAETMLDQFRQDYLWELAAMMSGDSDASDLKIAYGPEAWRKIAAQALPGIDEMLALITVMEQLEAGKQDLIVLDTAPTGHLLRFLEMPTALSDWLAWIFKLWIKYQDVLGRTEFMGRLRTLRQRVVQTQKLLKDPKYTEFIGVVQAQTAITAEAQRLTASLANMGIAQAVIVHNRYEPGQDITSLFPEQTIVRLPQLPRCVSPMERIDIAASLLF
jgi:arsenite-transporting ATPase